MKIQLMIIETNDSVRQNLVQRLSLNHCAIFETDQTKKIKEIIKKQEIDVVLLGLVGLKEQGLPVLKTIKRTRPLTEVIMINDSADVSLSIKAMKLGAFEDFYMPFEINTLMESIEKAYHQKIENVRNKKTFFQKYQDFMSAVAFAEMGEADTAISFLENVKKSSSNKTKPDQSVRKEKQNGIR